MEKKNITLKDIDDIVNQLYITKTYSATFGESNSPCFGRGLWEVLREVNVTITPYFEFAITFGAPLPNVRRTHFPTTPRAPNYLQYAAISGYLSASAMLPALHLPCSVSG